MSDDDLLLPPHERPERGPLKMPKVRRWTVFFVSFGVWLTGGKYADKACSQVCWMFFIQT